MTKFKKLITLTLVFVGVLGLAGCKPVEEGLTDLEMLAEALEEVELASEASSDLTFPSTGLHDVVITWASDNTDVIANDGTVTIPLFTDGDQTVTITASLTLGGETLTKTFEVTVLAATTKTDAEKVAEAKVVLLLATADLVVSDITLPATALDATVTWSSSNTDVVTDAGVVTRPLNGEGNAAVVLTATITVGDASDTKEFPLTIREEEPSTVFATIAEIHTASSLNDIVEFEGIVTSIFNGGYILTDGTDGILIFNAFASVKPDVDFGDLVYVKGSYLNYHSMYQIGDPTVQEIKSSDNAIPISPEVKTIAEMLALDSTTQTIHAKRYTVTGFITEGLDAYGNDALFITDEDDSILIYSYSLADSLIDLETFVGQKVTLTIFYYTDHGTKGVTVGFDGRTADITIAELSAADKLAADIAVVGESVPNATLTDITLPTAGALGTVYTNWVSDSVTIIANDGTFGVRGATTAIVTFTGDAANGAATGTATFTVIVPILSTIEEVLAMDQGSYFEVTGVVYEEASYGFFIHADGHYIFIYNSNFLDDIEPGDTVTILGKLGIYSGLLQVSVLTHSITDTDLALVSPVVLSVGALENDLVQRGTIATITGTLEERTDTYTNTFIVGPAGSAVQIYHASNAGELDNNIGDIVTITVVTYQNGIVLYQGVEADVVVESAFTDIQIAQDIADMIVIEDAEAVEGDLLLPLTNTDPAATMVWESSLPAVVAIDGVVNRVSGSDTLVTLTVTVTVNSVDATRDIVVNVIDATVGVPLSVADALLVADGEIVLVTGVVSGFYYEKPFIQDPDGTAIFIYTNMDTEVAIGDEIIIIAERATYTGNSNDLQQLKNAELVSIESSGNALVTFTDVTLADIAADTVAYQGKIVTISNFTITDTVYSGKDSYMEIVDGSTSFVISRYAIPYAILLFTDGEVISELTFIVYDIYYDGTRLLVTDYPMLTDEADIVAYVIDELDIDTTVTEDMTLPATDDDYTTTITWATSDAAVITDAGVVTRPANGAGDGTATLTATVVKGAVTDTVAFVITVTEEEPPAVPELFISEYIEGSSNHKALEIYNPTGSSVTLTGYRIDVYKNGAVTAELTLDLSSYTIASGDVLVICTDSFDGLPTASTANAHCDVELAYNAVVYYNGNDAVALVKDDVIIDLIGEIGNASDISWTGGALFEYTLVRDTTVVQGVATFDETQWIVYAQDTFTYLGSHTCDEPTS